MFFKKKKNNEYDSYEDDIYENEETIDSYGESDYNSNNYDETEIDEVIEVDETSENGNNYLDEYQEYDDKDKENSSYLSNSRDEIIVEDNLTDANDEYSDEYDDFSMDDEDDAYYEKERLNSNVFARIINIIFIILLISMTMIAVDVISVARYNNGPFFAIPLHTYKDGGTKEYYGIGYKVIKYNQVQGRRDKEIGFWNLKYNADPVTIQSIDLAIEFQKDEEKTYRKYYKKFVRIISTLENVDTKNNKITISYVDEGKKYSLDIDCSMASKNSNISKLEKGKEITIIGTVTKYDFKTKSKAGKLYISDCFAEQ